MYYEINVSRAEVKADGVERHYHFFATNERSCQTTQQALAVYEALLAAFPPPAFRISIAKFWNAGEYIAPADLLPIPSPPIPEDSHSHD